MFKQLKCTSQTETCDISNTRLLTYVNNGLTFHTFVVFWL